MTQVSYRNLHFPPSIAQQVISLYARFDLSLRDVEELLAKRGVEVSYETIRRWVSRFELQMMKRMQRTQNMPHPQ
tara:strand:- start:217 stop:441 length:225 start_codon:yes stop_codon:yes gene_type:complete